MNGTVALPSGGPAAPQKPRLLLAEDDPAMRDYLCEMLHPEYEVQAVEDGEAAWEALGGELPALVLSDVFMPRLDGLGLVRRLRSDARTAKLPFLLLTASHEKDLPLEGIKAGADDFLFKSDGVAELLVRLRTHRQLAETRRLSTARQNDERYRLIVESARDYAIFCFDDERRVNTWNLGAEVLTGFSAEDMIGQPIDLVFTPEDRERGQSAKEQRQAHEVGHYYNERWHLKKDGSRFWGSGVVMPLRESGSERSCLKILRDLTAAHQAEEDRAQLLAAEQAARQEAEAANKTKDHFLAALSHELRTPLAPVQMALYLMEREKKLPARVRESIKMIRRNVETEVRLIGDLLDVSRITHGKLELNPEPMDLHDCIRQALEVCREDFTAKALKLTVALEAREHRVFGETNRLQQVFWNLLKNAAKFTPQGGEITVRSTNNGDGIVVEVIDTGLGIEADALKKIFEPFEQGGPDRTRRFGGLGLGLAISQAIIAAHEGQLTAESLGQGQGSTFRVRLSTMAKEAVSASAPAAPAIE